MSTISQETDFYYGYNLDDALDSGGAIFNTETVGENTVTTITVVYQGMTKDDPPQNVNDVTYVQTITSDGETTTTSLFIPNDPD